MNNFPRSKKELLKEHLERMDANEHTQIFFIIKKYTNQFTKTENSVLISTDNLNDECLNEIEKYINFCLDQRKRMEEDLKTRKNYENLIRD